MTKSSVHRKGKTAKPTLSKMSAVSIEFVMSESLMVSARAMKAAYVAARP